MQIFDDFCAGHVQPGGRPGVVLRGGALPDERPQPGDDAVGLLRVPGGGRDGAWGFRFTHLQASRVINALPRLVPRSFALQGLRFSLGSAVLAVLAALETWAELFHEPYSQRLGPFLQPQIGV